MIIVTGAAGFIGSCLAKDLRSTCSDDIVLVDDFSIPAKSANLGALDDLERVERDDFFAWLEGSEWVPRAIFHLGARTDTTEFDYKVFEVLNLEFSKRIWNYCCKHDSFLLYASSAATYGGGERGYADDHELVEHLQPLNPYGRSKNEFDRWALTQTDAPEHWYGLKFFNVYGPNEGHKGRMASVVYHAFRQISETGKMKLFRSDHPDYRDGEQLRDFVYVKDVVNVCQFLYSARPENGLYNLGSGTARTFLDLVGAVFSAMDRRATVEFIDTPEDIRDKYQYFTEADMKKLRSTGYHREFASLEEGVGDYVRHYLARDRNF